MSRVTALIAEDEANLALALKDALAQSWPELQVLDIAGHGLAALEQVDEYAPDVLFLDIRMPGITGLQVAERLLQAGGRTPLIVFVTAYNEYAVQAFEREAVDYLVKPIDMQRLVQTVNRLKVRLAERAAQSTSGKDASGELSQALALLQRLGAGIASNVKPAPLKFLRAGLGETVRIVPVEEVIYLQAQDKYVSVFTADSEHLIRVSLKELADQLDLDVFVQVHRSTIVNLSAVESANRDFTGRTVLTLRGTEQRITVSRQYAHLFGRM